MMLVFIASAFSNARADARTSDGHGWCGEVTGEAEAASAIAQRLGQDPWTVTREVKRNLSPSGGYQPVHAEGWHLVRGPSAATTLTPRPRTLTAKRGTRPGSQSTAGTPREGI